MLNRLHHMLLLLYVRHVTARSLGIATPYTEQKTLKKRALPKVPNQQQKTDYTKGAAAKREKKDSNSSSGGKKRSRNDVAADAQVLLNCRLNTTTTLK